jgi:hypothetical protein
VKKKKESDAEKAKLEQVKEKRENSVAFNKKGLKNYVKSKDAQTKTDAAAKAAKLKVAEEKHARLEKARLEMQSRRGNTREVWMEQKKAKEMVSKQAKIAEHARAIEAEARRAEENKASLEAWELKARTRLAKTKKTTTRTVKKEISQAWDINTALKKATYYSPIINAMVVPAGDQVFNARQSYMEPIKETRWVYGQRAGVGVPKQANWVYD